MVSLLPFIVQSLFIIESLLPFIVQSLFIFPELRFVRFMFCVLFSFPFPFFFFVLQTIFSFFFVQFVLWYRVYTMSFKKPKKKKKKANSFFVRCDTSLSLRFRVFFPFAKKFQFLSHLVSVCRWLRKSSWNTCVQYTLLRINVVSSNETSRDRFSFICQPVTTSE